MAIFKKDFIFPVVSSFKYPAFNIIHLFGCVLQTGPNKTGITVLFAATCHFIAFHGYFLSWGYLQSSGETGHYREFALCNRLSGQPLNALFIKYHRICNKSKRVIRRNYFLIIIQRPTPHPIQIKICRFSGLRLIQ